MEFLSLRKFILFVFCAAVVLALTLSVFDGLGRRPEEGRGGKLSAANPSLQDATGQMEGADSEEGRVGLVQVMARDTNEERDMALLQLRNVRTGNEMRGLRIEFANEEGDLIQRTSNARGLVDIPKGTWGVNSWGEDIDSIWPRDLGEWESIKPLWVILKKPFLVFVHDNLGQPVEAANVQFGIRPGFGPAQSGGLEMFPRFLTTDSRGYCRLSESMGQWIDRVQVCKSGFDPTLVQIYEDAFDTIDVTLSRSIDASAKAIRFLDETGNRLKSIRVFAQALLSSSGGPSLVLVGTSNLEGRVELDGWVRESPIMVLVDPNGVQLRLITEWKDKGRGEVIDVSIPKTLAGRFATVLVGGSQVSISSFYRGIQTPWDPVPVPYRGKAVVDEDGMFDSCLPMDQEMAVTLATDGGSSWSQRIVVDSKKWIIAAPLGFDNVAMLEISPSGGEINKIIATSPTVVDPVLINEFEHDGTRVIAAVPADTMSLQVFPKLGGAITCVFKGTNLPEVLDVHFGPSVHVQLRVVDRQARPVTDLAARLELQGRPPIDPMSGDAWTKYPANQFHQSLDNRGIATFRVPAGTYKVIFTPLPWRDALPYAIAPLDPIKPIEAVDGLVVNCTVPGLRKVSVQIVAGARSEVPRRWILKHEQSGEGELILGETARTWLTGNQSTLLVEDMDGHVIGETHVPRGDEPVDLKVLLK